MQQIFMAIEGMGFAFSIAMIRYFFYFLFDCRQRLRYNIVILLFKV